MATIGPRDRVHINTAYFCHSSLDHLEIYFLSDPTAIHCKNLSENPSMAMTIFRSTQPWGTPGRGMQLFGTTTEAKGPMAKRAEQLYAKRFPSYAKWIASRRKNTKRLGKQLQSYRFYRFLPSKVKVLDEAQYGGAVLLTATLRPEK